VSQATKIEWTDVSWNPVHGCSKVSAGCNHCYAETLSLRYGQTTAPWTKRNEAENVLLKPHKLREPLSKAGPWKNPCRVFVNSMSDLFHEQIPFEYIRRSSPRWRRPRSTRSRC
jgi:protein gp37